MSGFVTGAEGAHVTAPGPTIAAAWVDPFGTLTPNGVRLDPIGDAPATFQVVFTGMEDATFDADITEGAAAADPFASDSSSAGGSSGGSFSSGSSFAAPSASVPTVTTAPTAAPAPSKPRKTARAAPIAVSRHAGETFGNLPFGSLLLLVGVLLLAGLTSWSLGAGGKDRAQIVRRQGGVSRALNSRQRPSNPS